MKEINCSLDFRIDYHNIISFSLERLIFVTDSGFERIIRFAIKDYLK
jgi:hypothetical protein